MSPSPSSSSSGGGVGLSDAQLSESRRRLLDTINGLHATGVQKDLDLPQIAVIGAQSAGKSSLIEAISGITLPRAAGTCTRCPTECKLAHSNEPWKCIVSLRFSTGPDGRALSQVKNEPFGAPIHDKSEVEERIRRAQRAILNPSKPHRQFLEGEDVDVHSEMTFSTNCVSLQISGEGVADLSFCDLPGLIASVSSSGQEGDIRLIEGLVTTYISKPSCIILLTVACETDFENQGAHRLAKEKDPEGKRTIGVLTKPDRIPTGEEFRWVQFVQNEREPLENGWYSVKQPSSTELREGITWDKARENEHAYFNNAPWGELDDMYKSHLGTKNLVSKLSIILSDLIAKRLPELSKELQQLIQQTEERLGLLPKPPSNDPFAEILVMLQNFVRDISKYVEGVAEPEGLLQKIRPAHESFKRSVLSTSPKFCPTSEAVPLLAPAFLQNEDANSSSEAYANTDESTLIYIGEVMHRAQMARTRELPANYPFAVKKSYISEYANKWEAPSRKLHQTVTNIVSGHVKRLVSDHFSGFGHNGLDRRIEAIMSEHLKMCSANALSKIQWMLNLESRPYTLNTHYLASYRDKFYTYYKTMRCAETNPRFMDAITNYKKNQGSVAEYEDDEPEGLQKVLIGLTEMGLYGIQPDDVAKVLPSDEMESALDIMADVHAYFHVAYKRITDNIPLALDHEIVLGLQEGLLSTLLKGLRLNGPNAVVMAEDLMQENHAVASRRAELKKKLDRLMTASEKLMNGVM